MADGGGVGTNGGGGSGGGGRHCAGLELHWLLCRGGGGLTPAWLLSKGAGCFGMSWLLNEGGGNLGMVWLFAKGGVGWATGCDSDGWRGSDSAQGLCGRPLVLAVASLLAERGCTCGCCPARSLSTCVDLACTMWSSGSACRCCCCCCCCVSGALGDCCACCASGFA